MFEIKEQLFEETSILGKAIRLSDAVTFAESRFQYDVNIWIERDGRVVCGYEDIAAAFPC